MDVITLTGSALALSMDNFAVAAVVTASLRRPTTWHTVRLCLNFGAFQSIMTALGCLGGTGISSFVGHTGAWIAFGLLMVLGINMVRNSPDDEQAEGYDPTKGWRIVGLSLACAVDALVAGISLSLVGTETWRLAPVFGLTAAVMAFVGTRVGRRVGLHLGQWPQRAGGIVLILIGLRGVVQQLLWQ
ncbi:MAG: manganese efflux pump MntP family protein [Desulfomonilaceae bacterium]